MNKKINDEKQISNLDVLNISGEKVTIDNLRKKTLTNRMFSRKKIIIIERIITENELLKDKQATEEIINILKQFKGKQNIDKTIIVWDEKIEERKLNINQTKILKILKQADKITKFEIPEKTWSLVDAIIDKNKITAIKLLSQEINKKNFNQFLSILSSQYISIIKIKEYISAKQNYSIETMAKELSLHPFVCKKSLTRANNYKANELKKIHHKLLMIDLWSKTKSINPKILLELFVLKN